MNDWKVTVIGGNKNGNDYSFSSISPVLVGRTHVADLRLEEGDVSGRHVELLMEGGRAKVKNLSRRVLRVDGHEIPTGETVPVKTGSTLYLGSRVRLRIDSVPHSLSARQASDEDAFSLESTPIAVMEEVAPSDTRTSATHFSEMPTEATKMPDMLTEATKMSEMPTEATKSPDMLTEATKMPNMLDEATKAPEFDPDATQPLDSQSTSQGIFTSEDDETETSNGEDKTKEARTVVAPMEEIIALKKKLAQQSKRRKFVILMGFALFAVALGFVWFITRMTQETTSMSIPRNGKGEMDLVKWKFRDSNGRALLFVEYPGGRDLNVEYLPGSNGVQVVSRMGRDRDVPFFLQFEAIERPDELKVGLEESVRRWMARTADLGLDFMLTGNGDASVKTYFFEDAYPFTCETKTDYGIRFARLEYIRQWPRGEQFHGVLIYFRRGATVFTLRREIPQNQWVRGGRQLMVEPNLAIYKEFSNEYWESPGIDGLPVDESVDKLFDIINGTLSRERPSEWRTIRGKPAIDAVLVKVWDANPRQRELAMDKLRRFREAVAKFYWGKYNAYQVAKGVGDYKRMSSLRRDCQKVFNDPTERYWNLASGEEGW